VSKLAMDCTVRDSNPSRGKRFSLFQIIRTGSGAHLASSSMSNGILWPRCEVDQSLPSSAKVKNEWSYTSTPPTCLHGMDRDNFTFMTEKDVEG